VDYSKLNVWVKREKHPLPYVDQVLGQLVAPRISPSLMLRAASGPYVGQVLGQLVAPRISPSLMLRAASGKFKQSRDSRLLTMF